MQSDQNSFCGHKFVFGLEWCQYISYDTCLDWCLCFLQTKNPFICLDVQDQLQTEDCEQYRESAIKFNFKNAMTDSDIDEYNNLNPPRFLPMVACYPLHVLYSV